MQTTLCYDFPLAHAKQTCVSWKEIIRRQHRYVTIVFTKQRSIIIKMYASLRQKDLVKDLKKERAGAFLGTYLLVTEPACPLGM